MDEYDDKGTEPTGSINSIVSRIGEKTALVADVAPLDVDGVRTIAAGTALWALAFVGLLPFYGRLADSGQGWWLWTCMAGFGLGLIGLEICRRRAQRSHG